MDTKRVRLAELKWMEDFCLQAQSRVLDPGDYGLGKEAAYETLLEETRFRIKEIEAGF